MKKRFLPLLVLAAAVSAGTLHAAFEETSVGARASALGGNHVSLADDVSALYHNPAGLIHLTRAEFSAQYSKLYIGLDDGSNLGTSFLGAAHPLHKNYGSIGFGWMRFELSGLYSEDSVQFSYARSGNFIKKPWGKKLTLGASLKYMRISYGQTDYTANALDTSGNATGRPDSLFEEFGTSVGALDLDLGFQYKLATNYRLGLMIANLFEPNMALSSSDSAPVYRSYKLGIVNLNETYSLGLDTMFKKFGKSTDWKVTPFAEKCFKEDFAVRGALTMGSRELANISLGAGYKIDDLRIDYSFVYPLNGIKDTFGNHKISLIFRFGPMIEAQWADRDELARRLDAEKRARTKAEHELGELKNELDKMRKEMDKRLSAPAPVIKTEEKKEEEMTTEPVAAPTPEPEKVTETSPAPAPVPAPVKAEPPKVSAPAEYAREFGSYKRSAKDMNLAERSTRLQNIIRKYDGKTNVSQARSEYNKIMTELKSQDRYFKESLQYYRNMAKYGIKKEERIDILKRMINKYRNMGIDVSEAQKELDNIK